MECLVPWSGIARRSLIALKYRLFRVHDMTSLALPAETIFVRSFSTVSGL